MLRLARRLLNSGAKTTPPTHTHSNDRSGRFDLDAAAEHLSLDPRYVKGLFLHMSETYNVRGPRYPADKLRTSRPGQKGYATRVSRSSQLERKRNVDFSRLTTE
jgi:hypothetical protein